MLFDGSSEDRQTGMSSWPQQLRLFLWLLFPDLINFCVGVCTNTVGLNVQLCVLEINHLFLYFILDLLCFCSSDSQTSKPHRLLILFSSSSILTASTFISSESPPFLLNVLSMVSRAATNDYLLCQFIL